MGCGGSQPRETDFVGRAWWGLGGCAIDTHQRQDRPPDAFRLAHGHPEDKAERQRRLDRTVRERFRRAWSTGRRRAPRVRGVGREPQRHVPSLDQGLRVR